MYSAMQQPNFATNREFQNATLCAHSQTWRTLRSAKVSCAASSVAADHAARCNVGWANTVNAAQPLHHARRIWSKQRWRWNGFEAVLSVRG